MTSLRQRFIEDMQIRNFSLVTQASYTREVSGFAQHFNKSPELLGPEQIRAYQVYLTNERKLATGSILIAISALRLNRPPSDVPSRQFRRLFLNYLQEASGFGRSIGHGV